MKKFIRLKDVSESTGIPMTTMSRWLRQGLGPDYKRTPTGNYLFSERDVQRWLESLEGPAKLAEDGDIDGHSDDAGC